MQRVRRSGWKVVAAATLSLSVAANGTVAALAYRDPMPFVLHTRAIFNDPTNTDPASPTNRHAIRNELLKLIKRAQRGSKVQIATFTFQDPLIDSALKAAFDRGVHVQVVADPIEVKTYNVYWNRLARALNSSSRDGSWARKCPLNPGGGCFVSHQGNKMHNKFAIFSNIGGQTVVFQSSNNFRPTGPKGGGDEQWNNAVTVVGKPLLHEQYQDYFDELGANALDGDHSGTVPAAHADGDGFTPYFFPDKSPDIDPVVAILNKVDCTRGPAGTTKVRVAMAFFTRPAVWEKLRSMDNGNSGCDVQVIYNRSKNHVTLPSGGLGGMKAWTLDKLHSKYLAIAGYYKGKPGTNQVVWTGSHNYTVPAWKYNDEVLLGIDDSTIHSDYVRNFTALKNAAQLTTS